MSAPNNIEQGETYAFSFDVSGDSGLTGVFNVLQYPGATPAITRDLTIVGDEFTGELTSAETSALAIGQWFIHANISDTDEDIRDPVKLYVGKGWL